MTIKEALKLGIKKVRLPRWEERAYLELPILKSGGFGPWAIIYDSATPEGLPILIFDLLKEERKDFEEFKEE